MIEFRVEVRVVRGRVIYRLRAEDPWTVIGRMESCPCCGIPVRFVEA